MSGRSDFKKRKDALHETNRKIRAGIKTAESYGTGLVNEKVMVASYKLLTIKQLEQIRYIINQIIKKKKISKRAK